MYMEAKGNPMRSPIRLVTRLRIVRQQEDPAGLCRRNADNTLETAQWARDYPRFAEYKKIEAAWRALAENEDWLDGKLYPA
jgi:hypothetical protein